MFFCVYCEIFKNFYFEKHVPTAASVDRKKFCRAAESQIEIKYKWKLKFIVYFEQVLQRVLVFLLLLLTLNR